MAEAKKLTMDELLEKAGDSVKQLAVGDTVRGKVLSVKKHEILIDLGANGVGMVPRREAAFSRDLEVGQEVSASVIDTEMDDGMVLLSMRKAVKEMQIPLESAVKCATVNPAKAIGIYDNYGSLTPGKAADVVLLDKDLEIQYIIKSGKIVFSK